MEDKRRKTTLQELGSSLPVGIHDGSGGLRKELAIRPWRTKEERELGTLKKPDANLAQYVGTVVGYMCTQLGHNNTENMKPAERAVIVSQMFAADVFYAYAYLRYVVMGDDMKMNVQCGTCSNKIPYTGNLGTLEVMTVDVVDDLLWDFELRDPIQARGKEIKKFRCSALRWETLEKVYANQSIAPIKIASIMGSVVGFNDDPAPVRLVDPEVDLVSKRDLERFAKNINDRWVGPNMAIEGVCTPEVCRRGGGVPFVSMIDWNYESFFSVSSQ